MDRMSLAPCIACLRWLAAVALLCKVMPAGAANFTVSPVRVELTAQHPVASLTIRNEMSDEPVVVQLRSVAWTQQDGREVHSDTADLLATPPIFTLAPGASQVMRVGLRRPVVGDKEVAYRLFIREVPPEPKPDFAGVLTALEMSIPLFAKPRTPVAPALSWQLHSRPEGGYGLLVRNDGNAHVQIANLALNTQDSTQPVARYPGFAYLLPGQSHEIVLQTDAQAASPQKSSPLKMTAYTDAGDIEIPLPLDGR